MNGLDGLPASITISVSFVIPAQAGIQRDTDSLCHPLLDPRLRGDDKIDTLELSRHNRILETHSLKVIPAQAGIQVGLPSNPFEQVVPHRSPASGGMTRSDTEAA